MAFVAVSGVHAQDLYGPLGMSKFGTTDVMVFVKLDSISLNNNVATAWSLGVPRTAIHGYSKTPIVYFQLLSRFFCKNHKSETLKTTYYFNDGESAVMQPQSQTNTMRLHSTDRDLAEVACGRQFIDPTLVAHSLASARRGAAGAFALPN